MSAPLYGTLTPYTHDLRAKPQVTRRAYGAAVARLETWHGSVEVELRADGAFTVRTGPKHGPRNPVLTGNVNHDKEDPR